MAKSEVLDRTAAITRPRVGSRARSGVGRDWLLLALVTLGIGVVAQAVILYSTGGHIAAPLDDTYIHLQYAVQTADGHLLAYNNHEGYSSGASSFLYVMLLAAFAKLGARGDDLLLVAQVMNTALYAVSAILLYTLGRRLRGRAVGLVAAGLLILNGRLMWGFASGMEVALAVTLVCATMLVVHIVFWPRPRQVGAAPVTRPADPRLRQRWMVGLGLVACGLAWVRQEGLFLVWIVAAWAILRAWRTRRDADAALALGAAALVGLTPLALNWLFTGHIAPNSGVVKSIYFGTYPPPPLLDILRALFGGFTNRLTELFAVSLGNASSPPFGPLFAVLGLFPGVVREVRRRVPGYYSLNVLLLFGGLLIISQLPQVSYGRYQMPLYPFLALWVAVGMYDLARGLAGAWRPDAAGGVRRRALGFFWGQAALALMMLAGTLIAFWTFLGENVIEIYNQQVTIGHWVHDNLPAGTTLAINDAGAIRYYGGHDTYDLVGLTNNNLTGLKAHGEGAVFEWLERRPPDARPDYFLVYDTWFPAITGLTAFLPEAQRWHLLNIRVAGGDTVMLHPANWAALGGGDQLWRDWSRDLVAQPVLSATLGTSLPTAQDGTWPVGQVIVTNTTPVQLQLAPLAAHPLQVDRLTLTNAASGEYTRLEARDATILSGTQVLPPTWATGDEADGQWALVDTHVVGRADETLPPLVFSTTLTAGTYRLDYSGGLGGPYTPLLSLPASPGAALLVPQPGLPQTRRLVAAVDVADLESEKAVGYQLSRRQWNDETRSMVYQRTYRDGPTRPLIDGGRETTGGEEMTITVTPGRDLQIVRRYLADTIYTLDVRVNGQQAPSWTLPAAQGWAEAAYVLPAALLRSPTADLQFTLVPTGQTNIYNSYYYWFYQQ